MIIMAIMVLKAISLTLCIATVVVNVMFIEGFLFTSQRLLMKPLRSYLVNRDTISASNEDSDDAALILEQEKHDKQIKKAISFLETTKIDWEQLPVSLKATFTEELLE